jgi:hypothetical protein
MSRARRAGLPATLLFFAAALAPILLRAQDPCAGTAAGSSCDVVLDFSPAEAAAHPDPYHDLEVYAELRSPRFTTYRIPAFWDGGQKMILRLTPIVDGLWTYRISGGLPTLNGAERSFQATPSNFPGFIHPANVHHWQTGNKKAHLWLADIADRLAFVPRAQFDLRLAQTVKNKFTHLRISLLGNAGDRALVFDHGRPNIDFFRELDRRIRAINAFGITADLLLADTPADLAALAPDAASRRPLLRFLTGRYAPLNVTWEGFREFETYPGSRALLKELGDGLKQFDGYQHPRSTAALRTSAPLLNDGWMTFIIERNTEPGDDALAQIEHQLYPVPFVGITAAARLWDATADGQYPMFEGHQQFEAKFWYDFISDSRHWELEPYYDVDGGRAIALEGVEYILFIDHPGPPVEIEVEKHSYDVAWLNPLTGETQWEKKKYHGEHYTGQPPDNSHPWVLRVSREGEKESMLQSYYFESKDIAMQEVEGNPDKLVYQIAQPSADTLPTGKPVPFEAHLTRESRATRTMLYLWTGEVPGQGDGFRVLATGAKGEFTIPPHLGVDYPANMILRLYGLNANGKLYEVDRGYGLSQ